MPASVELYDLETGLTLTATFYADGVYTPVSAHSNLACTETASPMLYTVPATNLTGLHRIQVKEGSDILYNAWAYLAASGTIASYPSREGALQAIQLVASVTVPDRVARASQRPNLITIVRGDTLRRTFAVTGTVTKAWFTVKTSHQDADADAILQVTMAGGLVTVNGEVAADSSKATLIQSGSNVLLYVAESIIKDLLPGKNLFWDFRYKTTDVMTPQQGEFEVTSSVTDAVT